MLDLRSNPNSKAIGIRSRAKWEVLKRIRYGIRAIGRTEVELPISEVHQIACYSPFPTQNYNESQRFGSGFDRDRFRLGRRNLWISRFDRRFGGRYDDDVTPLFLFHRNFRRFERFQGFG